ncbi:uncharacterized protein LOC124814657 [Hydra vulgaris]|uniref:uncharacterized protein LOC124814657 n=1 Tax=Hydra vulgaris TaxID=6087 RepID=UPI001F5FEA70|nr:uncharacterized protein LOC124814657 [Hydra vulgaris]
MSTPYPTGQLAALAANWPDKCQAYHFQQPKLAPTSLTTTLNWASAFKHGSEANLAVNTAVKGNAKIVESKSKLYRWAFLKKVQQNHSLTTIAAKPNELIIIEFDSNEQRNVLLSNAKQLALIDELNSVYIRPDQSNFYCKPSIEVTFNANIFLYVLDINFYLNYSDLTESAFNISWEYFVPPFTKLQYENTSVVVVKTYSNDFKYKIFNLTYNGVYQRMTFTINNTMCLFGGTYEIDIPIKVYFENAVGKSWHTFKNVIRQLKKSNAYNVMPTDPNHLPEYYARGIYWDDTSSKIYLCMNQYVATMQKPACFNSRNDGVLWRAIDIRVGAVLGHHILSRELIAIHRNQKLYLTYNNAFKKWLAVTNSEFEINVSKNLNWTRLKTLEGGYDQVVSFGKNQWMGNEDGLHFKTFGDNNWIQRAKWND